MEQHLEQFIQEIEANPTVDLILYPEGYCQVTHLDEVKELAKRFQTAVVMGYRNEQNVDRALIINKRGETLLDRAKTPEAMPLLMPSTVEDDGRRYGYVLCREIFMGLDGRELLTTCLLGNLKWELLGKTVLFLATVMDQARRAVPALGCFGRRGATG